MDADPINMPRSRAHRALTRLSCSSTRSEGVAHESSNSRFHDSGNSCSRAILYSQRVGCRPIRSWPSRAAPLSQRASRPAMNANIAVTKSSAAGPDASKPKKAPRNRVAITPQTRRAVIVHK
jgi:hypothetical protein